MLRLREITDILNSYHFNLYGIAKEINVPYRKLWYALNKAENPSYYIIERLSDYIESTIKQKAGHNE